MKKKVTTPPPTPPTPTVTLIEKRIQKAAETEAIQLWDTTHAATMVAATDLISALPEGYSAGNKLLSGGDYATGATLYDSHSDTKKRTYHGSTAMLRSIEFKPAFLVQEVKRAWIKKKTTELMASKIEMLLKSTGML